MTLKMLFGRRWVRALGLAGVAAAGYVFGITSDRLTAQQPGNLPASIADKRVVAYIYGNIPVTREDLGEFLIARGGHEKLELLVNKKIIEVEAQKRNVTVTWNEIESGLNEDLRGMGISLADFQKHVLPRYNKSLYEWTEDVIKPRILLGKMCRDRVKVTEEDLKKAFENRHGERRQAKVICWNKDDLKIAQKQWEEARQGDVEFDRVARTQADPNLASAAGLIAPVGKFPDVEDDTCTKILYTLKKGEISQLFQTPAGIMCIKCVAVVDPDPNVKFEGKVREAFEKEVFDKKMTATIPMFFNECKKTANPDLLLKGPPNPQDTRERVNSIIQQTGGTTPPMPTPMTPPMLPPAAPK
ncbi:MAG: hypothetical protein C0467_17035 [Planctomycetaceae bacterium]|nr:hypothetical protein [Planctomycetaceae bacterium]